MDIQTPRFLTADITQNPSDKETLGEQADPLMLSIDDDDLVEILDKRIKASRDFYKENYDLYERRKKNETYIFGRQIAQLEKNGDLKEYENKNLDNVLYEIEANIKPIAMSQLPDMIVTPGNQSDNSTASADLLTKVVDTDIKNRNNRIVLALAFKHRPIYFVGIIKCLWNPELAGGLGDYEYVAVHPDKIDFDHTVTEPDADKMKFISQLVTLSVQEVIMRFPQAEEKLWEQLNKDGIAKDLKNKWKYMATPIDIREVWFHEYKQLESKKEGERGKWQRIEGVCWKYKRVMLKKMKNPHFDYQGETQLFTYETPGLQSSKEALTLEQMKASMVTGVFPPNLSEETVYHNYFRAPRKPYYFMTYDQFGKQPIDETSALEQNIRNQEVLDIRLKNINEKLNTRGHHIWSKESGLKPADIEKMDHNNPNEDYLVDNKVTDVHEFVPPEQPTAQEFSDMQQIRQRMHELAGDNATRGELKNNTPATSTQIAREANYTRADDLVDETINPAASWMAEWALQLIKLRYTQEHFRWLLGAKGEMLHMRLHQNLVEDGMEVMIKASGTDKLKAQNNAMDMAKMELTDPLTFFQDMGVPDPEGRTVKLMMFTANPQAYLAAFVKESKTVSEDLIAKLQMLTPTAPAIAPGGAPAPAPLPANPAVPPAPQPTPQNPAATAAAPPVVPAGSPRVL
jgi:hypothetical protein